MMSRRALVLAEDGDHVTDEQIELIDELSDVTMELSELYAQESSNESRANEAVVIPEIVRKLRILGARSTMEVIGEDGVLSAYSMLAQTRSIIVDLLMVSGMSRESAVAQLAPTSDHPAYPPEVWDGE